MFDDENEKLKQSWDKYDHDHLDSYLVSGVEDPRINCQSILTRSLIVDSLWPGEFNNLIDAEFRFGTVLTWIFTQLDTGQDRNKMLDSIADGTVEETMVTETFEWLQTDSCPIPDYISAALIKSGLDDPDELVLERTLDAFRDVWRAELADRTTKRFSLLEPACGSANDFRFLDGFGLANFIEYAGFDISAKNIENASTRFPDARFFVGSILESGLPDNSFDCVVVHDLFEYLSPEGLEYALEEVTRVARREAWLHFFNVAEIADHEILTVDQYYRNKLSLNRLKESLARHGGEMDVVSIPRLLRDKFGFNSHHNQNAVTILLTNQAIPLSRTRESAAAQ